MKYCEEIIVKIEKGLKGGLSQKTVCDYVGISSVTFFEWMKKVKFSNRIKAAQAIQKHDLLAKIAKAGEKSWQAYAWILERCYHEEFGIRTKNEIEVGEGMEIFFKNWSDMKIAAEKGKE